MHLVKFALKNLFGAGLRTWLNIIVLAIIITFIIFMQGLYDGMGLRIEQARIAEETGQSQYHYHTYNPKDPFSIDESHGPAPDLGPGYAPILIQSGVIYPKHRFRAVIFKGIPPEQKVLDFPTTYLQHTPNQNPVMLGSRMAKSIGLQEGDEFIARWTSINGSVDAKTFTIVKVFDTDTPAIDSGQIWLPLKNMQEYFEAPGHSTIIVSSQTELEKLDNWNSKKLEELLADTRTMMEQKQASSKFLYALMLFLALVSIFDSQVLAIFRRKKEVGLLLALGLTGPQVVLTFILESCIQGIIATCLSLLIGGPILYYVSQQGIDVFALSVEQFGMAGGGVLYPAYSLSFIISFLTILSVLLITLSYWPARKISKLLPAQALRGNW